MEVSGVLFDLYGTLISHDNADSAWSNWRTCFADFLQQEGVHLEADFDFWLSFWRGEFVPQNNMSPFENRIKHFCDQHHVFLNREQITAFAQQLCQTWQDELKLDPQAVPLLRHLKQENKIVGLISNFDHPSHVQTYLKRVHLLQYFDVVVISGDVGINKPNAEIFRFAFEATGLCCGNTVYIGDSIIDYEAATAAGIQPIIIRRQGDKKPVAEVKGKYAASDQFLAEMVERGQLLMIQSLSQLRDILF
jgi:HAD superfamily hydrolase (TIGR01549 family)